MMRMSITKCRGSRLATKSRGSEVRVRVRVKVVKKEKSLHVKKNNVLAQLIYCTFCEVRNCRLEIGCLY